MERQWLIHRSFLMSTRAYWVILRQAWRPAGSLPRFVPMVGSAYMGIIYGGARNLQRRSLHNALRRGRSHWRARARIDHHLVLIVEQPVLIDVKERCGRSCATVDIQREKKARPPKTTGLIVGDERAKNDPATSQDRIAHLSFPGCREIEIKSPLGLPVDSIVAGDARRMLVATQHRSW